jgi:hypothetical protein
MRLGFTTHAVDQYIRRHAPGLSHDEARATLEAAAPGARKLREKTLKRDTQWEIPSLGIILVTKEERGDWVVVTVLPSPNAPAPLPPLDFDDCLPRVVALAPPGPLAPPAPKKKAPSHPEGRIRALELELAQARQAREEDRQRAQRQREIDLAHAHRAREKDREKAKRHAEYMEKERAVARHCLRLALRLVRAVEPDHERDVEALHAEIAAVYPSFLTDAFLDGGKADAALVAPRTDTNDLRGLAAREAGE